MDEEALEQATQEMATDIGDFVTALMAKYGKRLPPPLLITIFQAAGQELGRMQQHTHSLMLAMAPEERAAHLAELDKKILDSHTNRH